MKKCNPVYIYPIIAMLALLTAWPVMANKDDHNENITFGIVPQQAAAKLAGQWVPLMHYLEEQTGKRFVFRTAPDIPTFEQRLLDGEYDFAYMNPYHYVVLHEKAGYQAIARARDKKLVGILVARKDSQLKTLEEFNGETFAFPSPAAFAASIITRVELQNRGIAFTPKYVSSHDSVYRSVAAGLYPIGGGVKRTFNSVNEIIRNQLEIVWTSPGSTPHAIAHHPRIEKVLVESVGNALEALELAPNGRTILNNLKIKGFMSSVDSDWNDVRDLNINAAVGLVP